MDTVVMDKVVINKATCLKKTWMWRAALLVVPLTLSSAVLASTQVKNAGTAANVAVVKTAENLSIKETIKEGKASVHNAWRRHGLGMFERYSKLEPVVHENVIYVPSSIGKVAALDKTSGAKLWELKLNDRLIAGPTVANGKLYLGTKTAKVIAIDLANRKVDWELQLDNVMSVAPTIEGNKIIVQTVDGKLMAYEQESKALMWIYERSMPTLILRGGSQPVVSDNTVISGFANGRVVALDLDSGAIRWERTVAESTAQSEVKRLNDIVADPIVKDGLIYVVTYQGKVAALDLREGNILWSSSMSSYQNIAIDEENLYISDTDNSVWALDRMSGQVIWTQKEFKNALTGPTLVHSYVVLGDDSGKLYWLSKNDGKILASKRVKGGSFENTPIAYQSINGVITTQLDGKLAAYVIHQGK